MMILPRALLVTLILPATLLGQKIAANPANYRRKAGRLEPGQTLVLAPGRYEHGLRLVGLHGRQGRPITIAGRRGKTLFPARAGANTIDLSDASWIVLRDLDLDGRGLPVDGIKAGGDTSCGVHHITIEGCTIRGHGAGQMIVGISTKVPCWDWVIRANTIVGAGTGLYLGNSDGRQPFIGGLIESNIVVDPLGYCLQIKHQIERPDLPGLPEKPRTTIIRHNLFIKSDAPSPAGDRPNLLVGGFPARGPGAQDRYEIEANILFHNPREALIQGTGRLELRGNLFLDCPDLALRIMPHHGQRPRLVELRDNAFFGVGRTLAVTGLERSGSSHRQRNRRLVARAARSRLAELAKAIENPALPPLLERIKRSLR